MTEIAHRAQGQTALTITEDQASFNDTQLSALAQIGVDTNRPGDVAVFFHQVKRTGLDPFNGEIYMITRKGKPTIQTGVHGYMKLAHRAARTEGVSWGIETFWCGKDGQWRDVWLEKTPPAAAKTVVHKGDAKFVAVAVTEEYKASGPMWEKMPARMVGKCAEVLAIRKAFPNDTSGIYAEEEMEQAGNPAPQQSRQPQQPQPQGDRFGLGGNFRAPAPQTGPVGQEPRGDQGEPVIMSDRNQWAAVNELMESIGITEGKDKATEMHRWASEQGITRELGSMKDLTADEADQFADYLRQVSNPAAEDAA